MKKKNLIFGLLMAVILAFALPVFADVTHTIKLDDQVIGTVVCPSGTTPCSDCSYWSGVCQTGGVEFCQVPLPTGCDGTVTRPCVIPPSPCAAVGDSCANQISSATSLNFPICRDINKGWFGYINPSVVNCGSSQFTVPYGVTAWFLIDVSKIPPGGFQWPGGSTMTIMVADYAQGTTGGQPMATVYPLDASGRVTVAGKSGGLPQPGVDNWTYTFNTLPVSLRYLVKVYENGVSVPLTITYHP